MYRVRSSKKEVFTFTVGFVAHSRVVDECWIVVTMLATVSLSQVTIVTILKQGGIFKFCHENSNFNSY